MSKLGVMLFLSLQCACRGPSDGARVADASPAAAETGPAADAREAPRDQALRQEMGRHFGAITAIQQAVVRGHLEDAKGHAQWLRDNLEAPGVAGRDVEIAAVREMAGTLAGATTLPAAARVAARLGAACATCHLAANATTTFAYVPLPEKSTVLAEQMRRHQWAAARMWEGLVGPSNQLWQSGAETLAAAPLIDDPRLAASARASEFTALARRVHELAEAARGSDDWPARTEIFGDLMTTCSSCHTEAWPLVRFVASGGK